MKSADSKKSLNIAVIAGDGIGPETTAEAKKVLLVAQERFGFRIQFEDFPLNADEYLRNQRTLTDEDLKRFRNEFDGVFFGAIGDRRVPNNQHAREILLGLRFKLDLYINFRPVRLMDADLCPLKNKREEDVQFVVFRENTEGLYRNIGGAFREETDQELGIETMVNSRFGIERIIRAACEYAREKKLKKVCMIDKSNALQYGHGLWKKIWNEIREEYPELETKHLYVDAAAMEMVRRPEQFQVIVTSNLFGDILSDLGAQLQGGMGLAASINYHPGRAALFEPVHGTAPDLAGKSEANPMASILTASLLLEYFGQMDAARKVEEGVRQAIKNKVTTKDLGGTATTKAVGDFVSEHIRKN